MTELEKSLKRIEDKYDSYESELNSAEDEEEVFLDISVLTELADYVPFLIETIRNQREEINLLKAKE